MKCPHCPESDLVMTDRQGVEIDYCPRCRGVWLDRGELDKILERAAEYDRSAPRGYDRRDDDDDDDRRRQYPTDPRQYPADPRHHNADYRHHKKKSFWSELFD